MWGGGHVDYYGNEVYALNLGKNTLTRLTNPGPVASPSSDAEVLGDGTPNSRHTYDGLAYIAHANRMFAFSGSLASSNGNASGYTWTLDLSTLKWQQMTPVHGDQPVPGFGVVADYDPVTKNVFLHDIHNFFQYNYDTNTYTALTGNSSDTYVIDYHDTAVIDPTRRLFVIMGNGDFKAISIASGSNYSLQDWSSASSGCSGLFSADSPGLAYDSALNQIVGWPGGNTIYILNPDTKSCKTMTFSGGPGAEQGNGTFGRFRYFPALDVFAVVNDSQQNAYLLKLSGSSSPSAPTISNVNANSITTTSATITWTTDVGATSQVEYGTSTSYGSSTTVNSTLVSSHSVSLSGLSPGTAYHFRVDSNNSAGVQAMSGDFSFSTLPTTGPAPPSGSTHLDFKYSSSQALKAAGWSYMATTASGGQRNTEQPAGKLAVSYDQTAH
ncbi:MAG TPA: fibronectin type III domain-containing protein, partial [Terriglobales bacterium]|nr:fibronectin type III domain-containing protein [Terriglobales bacterium]